MKILERYLGINIIQTTLLVLLMLIGLSIFISLFRELSAVGTGDYRLLNALEYVILDLPQQLYGLFPVAGLLGILLGLGTLATHNELTVMRGSGMSLSEISKSVLKAALLMLIVATLLGEGLAPIAEHIAESKKDLLTSSGQALETTRGTWIRDGQNFLYLRAIINSHHIEGVSRYQFDSNSNLISVSYAQRGLYDHHHWTMFNVVESNVNSKKITTQQSTQADWQLSLSPDLLRISEIDPAEMSLLQLHNYIGYLESNNLSTSTYSLAFWQRITQPLATLVMMWLAIPFVFGPLRSATMGLRILSGAVIGFVFITLNQFFGPLATVYQLPPFIAASTPIVLFALVAYWLQTRAR